MDTQEQQQQQQQQDNVHKKQEYKLSAQSLSPILFGLILGFIIFAVFLIFWRRRSTGRRDFLLTGLCESGKTCIFIQLLHKKFQDTFTSMTVNIGTYRAANSTVRLLDIPGHYRVREKHFDLYKNTAKGIIFVVDSATIQKEIRDVADTLYTLLADSATTPCSFLVLCNKQDLATAKSAQVIKNMLEKELNIVRDTRSRKLQSVGEEDLNKFTFLGKEGRNFEFSQLTQRIEFYESTAKENELNNLIVWINKMM